MDLYECGACGAQCPAYKKASPEEASPCYCSYCGEGELELKGEITGSNGYYVIPIYPHSDPENGIEGPYATHAEMLPKAVEVNKTVTIYDALCWLCIKDTGPTIGMFTDEDLTTG